MARKGIILPTWVVVGAATGVTALGLLVGTLVYQESDKPSGSTSEPSSTSQEVERTPREEAKFQIAQTLIGSDLPVSVVNEHNFDIICDRLYTLSLDYETTARTMAADLGRAGDYANGNTAVYHNYVSTTDEEWCQGIRGY